MTNAAIIFMVVSVSSVVLLTAWCYYTVSEPRETPTVNRTTWKISEYAGRR